MEIYVYHKLGFHFAFAGVFRPQLQLDKREVSLVCCAHRVLHKSQESVSEQSIPAYPMLIDSSGGSTDLSEQGNQVAIMLNGVSVFRCVSSPWYLEGETINVPASACCGYTK